MAKIKHLIFDMGNVLMRYDPEVPLREYVSSEEARDLIRKELFQGPEWVERRHQNNAQHVRNALNA